jgi:hypothetical protein
MNKSYKPDIAILVFLLVICLPISLAIPVVCLYVDRFEEIMFSTNLWMVTLIILVPIFYMAYILPQRISISNESISYKKLGLFGFKTQILQSKDIEYWSTEGTNPVANPIVIKSKKGTYPNFPLGLNSDLSGILIITPIFKSKYPHIEQFFSNNNIQHRE